MTLVVEEDNEETTITMTPAIKTLINQEGTKIEEGISEIKIYSILHKE